MTSKNPDKTKHSPDGEPLIDRPADEIVPIVVECVALVESIEQRLGPMSRMTPDQRQHSNGRFRNGEAPMLVKILDLMDAHQQYFVGLAGKDRGHDAKKLETGPTRDDLALRAALQPLNDAVERLLGGLGDTTLRLGERVRHLTTPGYEIALANEEHDEALAAALAEPKSFYGDTARKAQRTRKAKAVAQVRAEVAPAGEGGGRSPEK